METLTHTSTAEGPVTPDSTPILEWSAPIHPVHERSPRWYLVGSIVVLCIAAYGVLTGGWTVTVVALLIGGMYFLMRREPPAMKHIAISTTGFFFDGDFTNWGDCAYFWIKRTPSHNELHILRHHKRPKEVSLQIAEIDPNALRAALSHFLEAKSDRKEGYLDVIIRLCKL